VALLVGASRAQVRTFGPAIERAGYQIAITTAAEHISDSHKPDRTTLLVCNQDIGPTAMLAAYHALPHRPALVVLHQQHALPGEGFAPEDRVSCGAVALERLLRQHAMPEPAATVDDTPPDAPEAPAPAPAAPPPAEPIAPTPAPAYGEEPEAEPEPEPEAEPEPEPLTTVAYGEEPEAEPEPEPEAEPEPEPLTTVAYGEEPEAEPEPEPEAEPEPEPLTTVAYGEEPEPEAELLTTVAYAEEPETETEPLTTVAYAEEPEAEPEPEPAEPTPPPLVTSPAPVEPMVIEPAPVSFEEGRYTVDVQEDAPAADDDDLPWERALEQEETEGPSPLWRRPLFWGAAAVVLAVVVGLVLLQQRSGTSVAQPPRPTPTIAQIVADSSTPASAAALSTPSPTIPNPPTATAAPVTTPTAAPSDPVPQDIDLVAQVLGIEPAQPQANEVVNVRVKIENRGSQDITQPFWVDLYVSPAQTPTVNQAWSDICQYGATWEVPRLSANESLVLETLQADTVRSNLFRLPEPNVEHIYVLIDSYGDEGNGAIIERDEENNLAEPIQVSISPQQAQP